MALNVVKVGVVGFGGRAGGVADTARQVTGGLLEVVGCTEIDDERYEQGCKHFQCRPTRYPTVEATVDAEKLDGVMIGTPNAFHLEGMRSLKGADVPVFLEKPLDSTWEKICDLVRFAESYDGPVMVGHCMRYAPIVRKASALIQDGAVGRVFSFRGVQNCHYGNNMFHGWRRRKDLGGTMWIEKATHDLDVLFALTQTKPLRLFAISKLQAFGGDKPDDLHCAVCDERVTCPENIQNIRERAGANLIPELNSHGRKSLCVYSREVDTWDNQACLMHLDDGGFGEYSECYFTARNYHHRIYELRGELGTLEIDLGEYEGELFLASRYGSYRDGYRFHFDYMGRNHYNGDHQMVRHLYRFFRGEEGPLTTVKQAFIAETAGYLAVSSSEQDAYLRYEDVVPEDLRYIWQESLW
ncbi:MAG: Gfo/Idh/MocA family oxidoreductase [Candidatus Pacebacteria bacterium]|nr:Gfo/Idh/MocA family oxidoreductase [Candidatus Paceibacterota bacterium]